MMSFFVLCHFYSLAQTLTAPQHECCPKLFTASLGDHPRFFTAVTPNVSGEGGAICSQALSHDTPQYTVG